MLYANGVSLKEIQEWLGHSTISTTANTYTHLDYSSKVATANAILGIYPGSCHPENQESGDKKEKTGLKKGNKNAHK